MAIKMIWSDIMHAVTAGFSSLNHLFAALPRKQCCAYIIQLTAVHVLLPVFSPLQWWDTPCHSSSCLSLSVPVIPAAAALARLSLCARIDQLLLWAGGSGAMGKPLMALPQDQKHSRQAPCPTGMTHWLCQKSLKTTSPHCMIQKKTSISLMQQGTKEQNHRVWLSSGQVAVSASEARPFVFVFKAKTQEAERKEEQTRS